MVNIYILVGGIGIVTAIVTYLLIKKHKTQGYMYANAYANAYDPRSTKPTLGTQNFQELTTHPILNYQRNQQSDVLQEWPVNYGDPIRGSYVSGPISFSGPYPGKPMGVPVPAGTLKETADLPPFNTKIDWLYLKYLLGFMSNDTMKSDFYKPYGPNMPMNTTRFFGNVDAYAPFPEVITPWEKAGILTSKNGDMILNLFRRPIAPSQNLWEYQVEDKDGFIIKLENKYIEDGDLVRDILGKTGMGPWVAHIFIQNKYVWV